MCTHTNEQVSAVFLRRSSQAGIDMHLNLIFPREQMYDVHAGRLLILIGARVTEKQQLSHQCEEKQRSRRARMKNVSSEKITSFQKEKKTAWLTGGGDEQCCWRSLCDGVTER